MTFRPHTQSPPASRALPGASLTSPSPSPRPSLMAPVPNSANMTQTPFIQHCGLLQPPTGFLCSLTSCVLQLINPTVQRRISHCWQECYQALTLGQCCSAVVVGWESKPRTITCVVSSAKRCVVASAKYMLRSFSGRSHACNVRGWD
jgi:hypothetical protein